MPTPHDVPLPLPRARETGQRQRTALHQHHKQPDRRGFPPPPGAAAALRGDDALARAAAEVAAPRRRLLAGLRDAHAETCLRIETLRRCVGNCGGRSGVLPALAARLLEEAEEQLHRAEIAFAHLHERPGGGLAAPAGADLAALAATGDPAAEAALLDAFEAEERRGAQEAAALRDLATLAGQHLAARLLDLTREERATAAEAIATRRGPGRTVTHLRH